MKKKVICIDLNKIPNLSHGVNFNFKEKKCKKYDFHPRKQIKKTNPRILPNGAKQNELFNCKQNQFSF